MHKSAWERLTAGRCNDGAEDTRKPRKAMTAAEVKRKACNRAALRKAGALFEQAKHLNGKDSRKLSDSWVKRTPSAALWREANAKPGPCITVTI